MINSTRDVLKMDFELLLGGHAESDNKEDVRLYLSYLEQLYAARLKDSPQVVTVTSLRNKSSSKWNFPATLRRC